MGRGHCQDHWAQITKGSIPQDLVISNRSWGERKRRGEIPYYRASLSAMKAVGGEEKALRVTASVCPSK